MVKQLVKENDLHNLNQLDTDTESAERTEWAEPTAQSEQGEEAEPVNTTDPNKPAEPSETNAPADPAEQTKNAFFIHNSGMRMARM